jgi:NAD(P)-dependent dehydrogenase (short-subunit alcohol dehydrogenase family)
MDHDPIDEIDLTSQVAIVAGGGRGIGRAIAIGLASAGASVTPRDPLADPAVEVDEMAQNAGSTGILRPDPANDRRAAPQARHVGGAPRLASSIRER